MRWTGPLRVTFNLFHPLFELKDLFTEDLSVMYGYRFQFFRNSKIEVFQDVRDHIFSYQDEFAASNHLVNIKDFRGKVLILVAYLNFDTAEQMCL